jgi:hypothetical protein
MKKTGKFLIGLLTGVLLPVSGFSQDNQKLAQAGFQFLSVVSDARAAAMAEAMTSLQVGSSALFFNPSGMSELTDLFDITFSRNQWIADITHYSFSCAVNPWDGRYGVAGVSIQSVDYGKFFGTRVDPDPNSEKGYIETGTFSPSAFVFGIGYAKRISDKFSVGGHVRKVYQDLGASWIPLVVNGDTSAQITSNRKDPWAFDFGTQFKTGFKSLVFGMSVRNFSQEVKYANEGFQLPLVFTIGASIDLMDFIGTSSTQQALFLSIDACHHRDHPEQLKIGVEYQFMNILSLRTGYATNNDESGISMGIGVSKFGFAFDYAYTPFGVFGNIQRMTARFSM